MPEPELALVVARGGKLVGYTVGNDMSSRDIEGANPLYLPQAKVMPPPRRARREEKKDATVQNTDVAIIESLLCTMESLFGARVA